MSVYKHYVGDALDTALFGSPYQSGPVADRDRAPRLHDGGMALPLQSKISGQLRGRWPQGDDVVNAAHAPLLQYVAAEVNPYRSSEFATDWIMKRPDELKTRGERLAWAREQAGYASKSEAARALGMKIPTYNSHERAGQPGARDFSPEDAEKYARAFRVAHSWLVTGKGDPKAGGDEVPPQLRPVDVSLGQYVVAGTVAAGAFLEVDTFSDEEPARIEAPADMKYPDARRVAFQISGDSMNRAKPPMLDGGYVLCVDFEDIDNRVILQDGMKVVVERTRDGGLLREWSVKEVEQFEDRIEFHPRSDNPRHKPIVVSRDFQTDEGTEVRILALVRSVFYPDV